MTEQRPLKILHLVGDHEDAGGVLSVLRNLDTVSAKAGWQHVVWVNDQYQESRQPSLSYRHSASVMAESTNHFALLRHAAPATRELQELCREESFDVIHAHSRGTLLVALLFSWRTKRPVIYTNHNYARGTRLYRWAARRSQMNTVVLTDNMARHYGLSLDSQRVTRISACYSDDYLQQPTINRRDLSDPKTPIRLIGVGSVIGWKKWDLIVEAVKRLSPELRRRISFDIWGPTLNLPEAITYDRQLRQAIQDHDLSEHVHLRGSTTNVPGELRQSDFFVLPSTNEPCSVALMEALAIGLPVIVSASGGNVDIVQPGCGLHFRPDDPESLRQSLETLIAKPNQFKAPDEIRDTVRSRCASQVFSHYRRLYHRLTDKQGNKD